MIMRCDKRYVFSCAARALGLLLTMAWQLDVVYTIPVRRGITKHSLGASFGVPDLRKVSGGAKGRKRKVPSLSAISVSSLKSALGWLVELVELAINPGIKMAATLSLARGEKGQNRW